MESGRAQVAHGCTLADVGGERPRLGVVGFAGERMAGGQRAIGQQLAAGDTYPLIVEVGALALFGVEQFVAQGIVDHTGDDFAFLL